MTVFHDQIQKVKDDGPIDFNHIPMNDHKIILRLVDDSNDTINLLTIWRNKFWDAFPEKFNATNERTRKWLNEQVLKKPDRILFLILLNKKKIGHIGIYRYDETENSAEIDNVVRAVRDQLPGLMEKVTRFLIDWMFKELNLSKIKLKVFSDNYKAINLYERCGMVTVGNIPLKRINTKSGWKWQETKLDATKEYGERYFITMEITRDAYFAKK